jgi:transposase
VGGEGIAAAPSPRPAHRLGLSVRRHLPRTWRGGGAGPAPRRYRGHGSAPRRDRPRRGAHAILLADQAGWHTTNRLATPANISLVPLPAKSPELNPVENVWQYLRQTWLSNRVFPDYEAILDACCRAWNNLMDRPWKIMSIGLREWARTGQH